MRAWPFALLAAVGLAACGSRTGLLVPGDGEPENNVDGSTGPSGDDDSGPPFSDAGPVSDALPPIDVTVPVDAFNDCPDAGATLIYVVSKQNELLSFYPPTATFTPIGILSCPDSDPTATPFSMAVDRTGIAYVLYSDGHLFRVSTATAACEATRFEPDQSGFTLFGMGYSHDDTDTGETLYVASGGTQTAPALATIDTQTFALHVVGSFRPTILNAELSGTGAGDLFAFYATQGAAPCNNMAAGVDCTDSAIGQIDKATGQVTAQTVLRGNAQGMAWAFAFWGGDFYTFTAPGGGTIVNRFSPADGTVVTVATRADFVVGAGVSTCAPAR